MFFNVGLNKKATKNSSDFATICHLDGFQMKVISFRFKFFKH